MRPCRQPRSHEALLLRRYGDLRSTCLRGVGRPAEPTEVSRDWSTEAREQPSGDIPAPPEALP
jgi:hypothetical protein